MSKDCHSGAPLRRRIYSGWWAVAVSAVGLSVSIGTVVVYSFGVFLKPLCREFNWSRSKVSLAISLMNLMVTLGSPSVGRLADRFGSRAVIVPSIVSLAAVLASFYFLGPHLWLLYILYSLAGLVGLGATPLTYSRVVATWFDQRRGLALGLTTSGIGIGAFLMPSLAQWIISQAGWRWAYASLGLVVLLVPLPLVALLLREAPRKSNSPSKNDGVATSSEPPNLGRSEAVRTRVFWQMVIQFFLISACINGTAAHFSALLTDRAVPAQAAAFAISLFGGASFAGRIVTGYFVDSFFAPYVIAVLFGGAAFALAILAAQSTGHLAYLAAVLMGLGVGAEADVRPYLVSRYFGIRTLGELFGYVFSSYTLGVAVGPLFMGAGFDATGSYRLPLIVFVVALIAAIVSTITLPRYARGGLHVHPSTGH